MSRRLHKWILLMGLSGALFASAACQFAGRFLNSWLDAGETEDRGWAEELGEDIDDWLDRFD